MKKKKNKGFSLVELIVVMAIMAILAVTLAPALTKYVEKSRKAADREVVSAIYTTVQYALLDETLSKAVADAKALETATPGTGFDLDTGLSLNSTSTESAKTEVYKVNDGVWKINNTAPAAPATDTSYTSKSNLFIQEIYNVVGDFKLKSKDANDATDIVILYNSTTKVLSVELQYDGSAADYTVSSADVK